MVAEIALSQGQVALVDDADFESLIRGAKWQAMWQPHRSRFVVGRHVRVNGKRTTEYMHQFLTGFPQTDHINHNALDNRRTNLRAANNTQNKQNSPKYRGGTSQYKGVCRVAAKIERPWKASIAVDGIDKYLGYYAEEIDAAKAYDTAARLHFGEFAYCNFPSNGASLIESK